jgi:hypothetical protein
MKIKSTKDLYSGVAFLITGIGFLSLSQKYIVGTAAEMGPGYFPALFSSILIIISLALIIKSVLWKS